MPNSLEAIHLHNKSPQICARQGIDSNSVPGTNLRPTHLRIYASALPRIRASAHLRILPDAADPCLARNCFLLRYEVTCTDLHVNRMQAILLRQFRAWHERERERTPERPDGEAVPPKSMWKRFQQLFPHRRFGLGQEKLRLATFQCRRTSIQG